MHLSSDDVAQIVQEVWTSMLGLDVEPVEVDIDGNVPAVAGSVGVSGATDCLISMEMQEAAAKAVAAAMFGLDGDDISDDDVADAVGELTNMVGGNIKSLLPEPSTLSVPVVAHGRIPTLKVVGGKILMSQAFLSGEHPVLVSVWNRPQRA
ncbi:chemotaxis protein CheX [Kineosphaera limosa]|uniref:Chemotaxis phosphatase CheX-like domain-containing protein n=1 Tax=Kineosphaera limosa NBRC 100340 TaxID=1184609 RepID=K6WWA1_9MICO|nr:chemotaxis protein CheX [Kineosphaera limosa]NYD99833.1 chemotaxis protein CheX [Kineosphaera limosa]GAB98121.1 hypothetical protein KILIM_101_00160 [Kineosphaera limosa NBRC 100340]